MSAESFANLASWWIGVLGTQSFNVSVIFVLVLMLTRPLRRSGPSIRLALWGLVFLRLVLPLGLSHPWCIGVLTEKIVSKDLAVGIHEGRGSGTSDYAMSSGSGRTRDDLLSHRTSTGLAILWLFGAATTMAIYRRRLELFYRHVRDARIVEEPVLRELVGKWRRRLHVRRRVRIVASSTEVPPFTLGVVRPLVFVPQSIVEDQKLMEPVVAHELAHVARWDALWLGLQHVLQAVFFFHPLVWVAGARLDEERERLCDATVVAAGRIPAREYVIGLLEVAQLDLQGARGLTMSARKRRIGMRIQDILRFDGAHRPRLLLAVAVASLLGIFLLPLGAGGMNAEDGAAAHSEKPAAPPASVGSRIEFDNPLPGGRVTWRWGPGVDPWTKEEVFHRGIDVAAGAGTPVLAPADGVVAIATEHFGESPTSGTVIVIDHGEGWTTFYAHLGSLDVAEDQRVSRNDVIAGVGSTGKSTGPHLHFEIRHDGEQLNPADFVSDWQ